MPEILEAKFRIVTPMFLGGANRDTSDGIRAPSVKGALRFWWRALNWGRFAGQTSCVESALVLLHDDEVRLFGGSAEQGGQGCFHLSVVHDHRLPQSISNWPQNNTGAGYLAFGILESGSHAAGNYQPHRSAVQEGRPFRLRIVFRPKTNDTDIASIQASLRTWGLLGGLGSRSRRGMGSVTLVGANDSLPDQSNYSDDVNAILNSHANVPLAPYTSFSKECRFRTLALDSDPRRALGNAGQTYKSARGQPSQLRGVVKIPFGLPLQGVDTEARRASPLFFHVHALAGGQYVVSVLYMPSALFHPKYLGVRFDTVATFVNGVGV